MNILVKETQRDFLAQLTYRGTHTSDSEELRVKKAILTFISGTIALLAVFWGSLYVYTGFPISGAIPLTYLASLEYL